MERIDKLLEKKPLTTYNGELIYRVEDITRFIDLMPKATEEDSNPIFHAGLVSEEDQIDPLLLDEFKRARCPKPFFKQGITDKILFIEKMDRFQERQALVDRRNSIQILRE